VAEEKDQQSEKMESDRPAHRRHRRMIQQYLTVITGPSEILAGAVAKEPQLAAITRMNRRGRGPAAADLTSIFWPSRAGSRCSEGGRCQYADHRPANCIRSDARRALEIESVFKDETCFATVAPTIFATRSSIWRNSRDRHAARRQAHPGNRLGHSGRGLCDMHDDVQPATMPDRRQRQPETGIPSGMLDKVFNPFFTSKGRARHRPRPEHGLWIHQAVRRPHQDL